MIADDIRNLAKWLNEEQTAELDRQALARVLAYLQHSPAAPVQEPVAYAVYHRMGGSKTLHWPEQHSEDGDAKEYKLVPLYTTPPAAQRQWVGLTDEEISACDPHKECWGLHEAVRRAEAKLREKNGGQA